MSAPQFVVVVTGGRKYQNKERVLAELDLVHARQAITMLAVGDATGADCWARCWAIERRVALRVFKADWSQHGLSAGTIRNQEMLDQAKPDLVLAFPGQRGTADCVRRARAAGILVETVVDAQPANNPPVIVRRGL